METKRSFTRAAAVLAVVAVLLGLAAVSAYAQQQTVPPSPAASTQPPQSSPAAGSEGQPAASPTATAEGQGEATQPGEAGPVATQRPGPPANYYASYGLVAIMVVTILAIVAGYLFQAPGFRRASRGSAE